MLPLDEHRQARLAALEAEDGWLNLCDRVEIPPGPQSVGSSEDCTIRLSGRPAHLGTLLPGPDGFQFAAGG